MKKFVLLLIMIMMTLTIECIAQQKNQLLEDENRREPALLEILNLFEAHGYKINSHEILNNTVIFNSPKEAKRKLSEVFKIKESEVPDGISGTVYDNTLFIVTESLYHSQYKKIYPNFPWHDDEYHNLKVHELFHRAHEIVAIKIHGSSEGMGPEWFYEGMALMAAQQFEETYSNNLTADQLNKFFEDFRSNRLGKPLYPKITKYFSYVYNHLDFRWLIENAPRKNFEKLIIKKLF